MPSTFFVVVGRGVIHASIGAMVKAKGEDFDIRALDAKRARTLVEELGRYIACLPSSVLLYGAVFACRIVIGRGVLTYFTVPQRRRAP